MERPDDQGWIGPENGNEARNRAPRGSRSPGIVPNLVADPFAGAPPIPPAARWDWLPGVTRLISPPAASYRQDGSIWEIGWNGSWVKCWARPAPKGPG
jgi:hypothetical protein